MVDLNKVFDDGLKKLIEKYGEKLPHDVLNDAQKAILATLEEADLNSWAKDVAARVSDKLKEQLPDAGDKLVDAGLAVLDKVLNKDAPEPTPTPTPQPTPGLFPFITQLFAPCSHSYGRRGYVSTWDMFSHQMPDEVFDSILDFLSQDKRNNGVVCVAYGSGDGLMSLYQPFNNFGGELDESKLLAVRRRRQAFRERGLNLILTLICDGDHAEAKKDGPTWEKHIKKMNEIFEPEALAYSIESNEVEKVVGAHKINVIIKAIGTLTGKPCGTHTVSERWTPTEGDFLLDELRIGDIWQGHKLPPHLHVESAKQGQARFKRGKYIYHEYAVCTSEAGYRAARDAVANLELAGYG